MSEATEPALSDHRILIRPAMLTSRNDIMERRVLLVVTFMEEASWLACTLSLARPGGYGNLLEWIVYKWSATMLQAFISIPPGMPVANALLMHFLIHHGAKIAVHIPGGTAISIDGAGETSVQAIADIFSPSRLNICPKPARKSSLSLHCPASENVLIKRAIFSGHDVQSASQDRYMANIFLAQRFRDWRTIRLQLYHGRATNKNIRNSTHRNDVDGQNDTICVQVVELEKEHCQHSSTETQDTWEFYNYYPQVVSLLGIKQERDRRNTVVSSEYCLEDEDNRSCNDSGIDIPTPQIHVRAVQDTFNNDTPLRSGLGSRNAMHTASARGQRWSVDEMITLSLLEAMELRNNANNDAGRARDRTRSTKSFRRAIAKFIQKYFAILRG